MLLAIDVGNSNIVLGVFDEGGVGSDAHGEHQQIEVDGFAALHKSGVLLKPNGGVGQQKSNAVFFQILLHDGGAVGVENTRQHAVGEIAHGDVPYAVMNTLRTFEPDQPRADDQHARVGGEFLFKSKRVVQRHKAELLFNRFKPLKWRHKRA